LALGISSTVALSDCSISDEMNTIGEEGAQHSRHIVG
jgi:hypothetical protein